MSTKISIPGQKCFACGKPLKPGKYEQAETEDYAQIVWVGPDCFKKIKKSGADGYQPPLGGPRLLDTVGRYTREEE